MRAHTVIVRINIIARLYVGVMQQQEWVDLLYPLRWEWLPDGHVTHHRFMRVQKLAYSAIFHNNCPLRWGAEIEICFGIALH